MTGPKPRARSNDGGNLTIRIPRQMGTPTSSQPLMSPTHSNSHSRIVGKSKSLTTSMDKLSTPPQRSTSRNSSSRESSLGGSRGSTPSSARVVFRPPSRRSVQSARSPHTPERSAPDLDGKCCSPTGSEVSLHSSPSVNSSTHSVNSSPSVGSSDASVKSQASTRSCTSVHRDVVGLTRASSEPPTITLTPQRKGIQKTPPSGSLVASHPRNNGCKKVQVPLKRNSASVSSLNSSSRDVRLDEMSTPKSMSRKSTPTRQTPPHTQSASQRHSIGSTPNKKSLPVFNSYMSLFQVQEKLKKGEVIEGVLRINPKSYEDAYISAPDGGMDIFIGGVRDRNAALHGDIVAALLNPQNNWKVLYYQLDAYLEQNLDLKALVYTPLDSSIPCADNVNSELSSTIKTHNTNVNITNKKVKKIEADCDVLVEENSNPESECSSDGRDKKKKKNKKTRRGRKKKNGKEVIEALKESFLLSSGSAATGPISSPQETASSCTSTKETDSTLPTSTSNTNETVVVLPHELSECELSDDNESVRSLTLDLEDKLNLHNEAPIKYVNNVRLTNKRKNKSPGKPVESMNLTPAKVGETSVRLPNPGNCDRAKNNVKENKRFPAKTKDSNDRCEPSVMQVLRLPDWEKFVQKTANVVHILEKKHTMLAAGILKPFADKNPHMALFSPFDFRIPRIKIPMFKCPPDFMHRYGDYSKIILLAKITEWNEPNYAFGELVRNIGKMGNIEAETEAVLIENSVDYSEFSDTVLKDLPTLPWSIPSEEIEKRTDLRNSIIFSIDPSTARDLDDAVSCLALPSGNFRVGVHIADVTYFVKPGTLLDQIAAERSTSVYLIQKVIPMLPRILCESLCSLNPGEDRLAFSIIWELTPEGKIESEWFGRTVIRSCVKLAYEHAQSMIEEPEKEWSREEFPEIEGGHTVSQIVTIVNNLQKLALVLRERRVQNGALRLDQAKLGFSLDMESMTPNGIFVQEMKDSNRLIEEFMLLANITTAHKISETFPNLALLRNHLPPHNTQMENAIQFFKSHNIYLDASTSGTLNASIQKYNGTDDMSKARMQLIVNLCSKPMQYARYFCTGLAKNEEHFHHYALNLPRYTHFTSPIRRYADVMVHRLLAAAIDPILHPLPEMNAFAVDKKATHCNEKRQASKVVQEYSSELFLALFIRNIKEMIESGTIIGVLDRSVDVLITRLGVTKRCYMDKLPLVSSHFVEEDNRNSLIIEWKEDEKLNLPSLTQKLTYFNSVTVVLRPFENDALKFNAFLERPQQPIQ